MSFFLGSWGMNRSAGQTNRVKSCFKVVLRLILGRDFEQVIFNVETMLLISTSGKQTIFNVIFQR